MCICAAGNDNEAVGFPAAFPEVVAVSAIGLEGFGPAGSLASIRLPQDPQRFGSNLLYLANFSDFGSEVAACAPGVGVISTVPERFGLIAPYAAMDGTSMASPAVCGALAVLLSTNGEYQALPRNITRAEKARSVLKAACRDIGLAAIFQGQGMPLVS